MLITDLLPFLQRIYDLNEDFCGMDVNTPLGGEQPIEVVALLTFPVRLTAVAITSTETYTVVYLGTADGHLKKVGSVRALLTAT